MNTRGHTGVSLLLFSPVLLIMMLLELYMFAFIAAVSLPALARLMIPDRDQNLPFVRHRKHTHTLWAAPIVGLLFAPVFYLSHPVMTTGLSLMMSVLDASQLAPFISAVLTEATATNALVFAAFGFVLATYDTLAHVLADSLTFFRVQPLYPFRETRRGLGLFGWDNTIANSGAFILGSLTFALALIIPLYLTV